MAKMSMNLPNPSVGAQYGRWTLVHRIGGGGNGHVWRGRSGDEEAALKLLTKTKAVAYSRFRAEVQVMKTCGVAGVVPILDSHLPDNLMESRPWYAMPVGVPLDQQLQSASLHSVVEAIAAIAETLTELHASDVVHRDLKPANLLWINNRPSIGDFGLVDYPGKDDLTGARDELGPRWTMAPEIRRYGTTADPKPADVYSLAKSLWMLVTRELKGFEGQYSPSTSISIATSAHDQFVAPIEELLAISTDHSPEARPTMAEFARMLRDWLRLNEAFPERNALEWMDAQRRLFPVVTPNRAIWYELSQIALVLGVLAARSNMNHMFFPTGGGLDLHHATQSRREPGCLELKANGLTFILKPARLLFERVSEDAQWAYFRLEANPLEPSGVYEDNPSAIHEEVTDVGGELYADRGCWDEGYFEGEKLPKHSRMVTRFFAGSLVIFQKTSAYNRMTGGMDAYGAQHNKMTANQFRAHIAQLAGSLSRRGKLS